ncbi:hypothetical protein AVEN_29964-1 [Araneus ventricosus]|uniref:Uncharacterized protein n=1 Tax=Araneus ventricosus TaxID=182803 RepID=A0A4Y2Q1G4_ARAVE|nr:hypothetical protein AVEN_29964-1 [Araneus ventricosus]
MQWRHDSKARLASIYLRPPSVEEDMNMNTELLDDTLDEIFEETDSEDYNENESEMEELESKVSEFTERWAVDGKKKKNIPFEVNPGPGISPHKKVRPTSG